VVWLEFRRVLFRSCPALSFAVVLDEMGKIQDYSIHASMIKPTYRLTY
jgi:exoribonuclease-2